MSPSIVLIGQWFGPWPAWMDFFCISCQTNKDIDWIIFSDQAAPASAPPNLTVIRTSFSDYVESIKSKLPIKMDDTISPYKLCDFKPLLGYLHYDLIMNHDFFGFTDIDVIYGNIRDVYDDDILALYDALSSHTTQISGHLFLMRNNRRMRSAYRDIAGWRHSVQDVRYMGFDEHEFYKFFRPHSHGKRRLWGRRRKARYLFQESYSTPMPLDDFRWYWKNGVLSNELYPQRSFLYLHFMVWQSNKWFPYIANVAPGSPAPWQNLKEVVQIDWRQGQTDGFMISSAGIQAIETRPYPANAA